MVDKETVESKTDQDDDFNYKAEMKIREQSYMILVSSKVNLLKGIAQAKVL